LGGCAASGITARWAVQQRQAVAIKAAKSLLLNPHRDHAAEEILAQTRRGLAAEIARIRSLAPDALGRRWRAVSGGGPSGGGGAGTGAASAGPPTLANFDPHEAPDELGRRQRPWSCSGQVL
jgi:hypothetical protein